jgi:hypothetical protein
LAQLQSKSCCSALSFSYLYIAGPGTLMYSQQNVTTWGFARYQRGE